ncbi:MAG: GH3 auxin-responsive promoter family protein [Bacteroidales bacterium]|nr:GH3 auxin-responsive promoter family protein [Bacteroidales bacterium]
MKNIEHFMRHPFDIQEQWFHKLLQAGRQTIYGQKYGFENITDLESFGNNVPVVEYHDFYPYIQRVKNGEKNVLWNTPIRLFSKSSGTTSERSKFIPVSNESLHTCHFKAGRDTYSLYCNAYPDSQIFRGYALGMGGHLSKDLSNNMYVGDLSALLMKELPYFAQRKRKPPLNIALMDEWESKIEKLAETTISSDITHILGVPSWTLLLLKRILEKTQQPNIRSVWQNLEVFFHGGVSFEPYHKEYDRVISSDIRYFQTYNASEGYFAIQDRPDAKDMLLLLDHGIFYEFMPMAEVGKEHPKLLSLNEIELNVNYGLVITTNGGLWRYLVGDTIAFTSKEPFRIRITGRTRYFINAVGEEIILDNVENALQEVLSQCDAIVEEYTGGPVYAEHDRKARHEWIFEFDKAPDDIQNFTEMFDLALQKANSDYAAKRYQNMILDLPIIHIAPPGTFYEWMRQRGKLGGQHKVPRLANDRTHLDSILKM